MTDERAAPVLDVDRLDEVADTALVGVRLDLGAVRARAAGVGRRRTRRVVLVAAAAALLLAGLSASGAVVLGPPPQPAKVPTGPGALPERVYQAPRVLKQVTDAPVARVAVVLEDSVRAPWTAREGAGVVLVSADGGEYRGLPETGVGGVSLSADGRVVAWVSIVGDPFDGGGGREIRWVDVSTGKVGAVRLPVEADVGPEVQVENLTTVMPDGRRLRVGVGGQASVENLTVSSDGRRIAVSVSRQERPGTSDSTTVLDGWVVDTGTGEFDRICGLCTLSGGWDGAGRLLVAADSQVPLDRLSWLGRLPTDGGFGVGDSNAPAASTAPAAPVVLVSADGGRRLIMDESTGSSDSQRASFRIVEVDVRGVAVREVALGRLAAAQLLGWAGDRAWVKVTTDSLSSTAVVRQIDLRSGRSVEVLRSTEPQSAEQPSVVLIAADVAAGGRTAATPAPDEPWWAPVVEVLDVVRVLTAVLVEREAIALVALASGPFLVMRLIRAVRRRLRRDDLEPTP